MKDILRRILNKKLILCSFCVLLCIALFVSLVLVSTNAIVLLQTRDYIISAKDATELEGADCILVLGCLVRSDGIPSDMLADRLEQGIALYYDDIAPKILMSGDHGQIEYDEVNAMKKFALAKGVPSSDIFMDHAGFSTYESIYRAKEIFGADKIVIVTQGYHLPRALYVAKSLGIEAYGVASDLRTYRGQLVRDAREVLARSKDFAYTIIEPLPMYLGESISLLGDGNITNG